VFLSAIFSLDGAVPADMTIFSSDTDSVNPRASSSPLNIVGNMDCELEK
jgi:hypothetical protein